MEKFSWSGNIFANRSANHFLFKDFYRIQRRREHNEVYDAGGDASFVWERPKGLPEWSKLIFSTRLYYGDKNIPGSMSSRSVSKQKDFTTRQNIMLDMPFVFREDLSMEAAVSHSFSILDYTGPGSESLHKTDTVTVINRWEWFAGEKLSLQAGADYRFSYLDSDNIGVKTGHDGGLYLTAGYSPVRELLITPSVKVVFAGGDAGAVIPVPKLGVVWNASDRLTVKNNWYRSFKYPSFNDLYWAGDATARGNPDLKPEDGFGADLGTELTFEKLLSLQGTLYASWVRDSIHWRSSAGVWQPVNIGEALFFGFDTRIQSGFSERIILSLSYQFLLTRILTGDLTFASGIQMPYQPMHTAGVSVEIPWKTGNLTVSGHFESSRYTEALNVVKLDPFFILNISVNQSIGRHFTIFSVLKNALNTSYVSVQDYPMPGLSLTVGVRAAFE
ncbi:MAG: TonB-dependent receptor [Spirochaetaceae bacterium]|nr:TonB-dependent receptor [Spirochaetaceae bacterium]